MIEVGVFHNGASDLPVIVTEDGIAINQGTLADTQRSAARIQVNQVRQGVLADQLGFDYFFMTEHHFQPEGAEFSPNPLQTETAIAALTKRIRLGQGANILTWHHPVRIAEQAAMLDILSGGRLEFGIGRGYQPRETEVLGGQLGATIQDQERNRAFFEEAYDILLKCWTEESFSYHGEFFTLPPSYTRWNHRQTIAYFSQAGVGRSLDDVIKLGAPDMYSSGNPVLASTTKLTELQVYPQPIQKPHPQIWEPITSPRSVRFAAERGVNGYFIVEPNARLRENIALYYEEAAKAGWPDRLDRGEFKFGWDCERRRGIITGRYIHIVDKGIGDMDRAGRALEVQWDYYGPFGFAAVLADPGEEVDMGRKVTAEELRRRGTAIHGSVDQVISRIMEIKEVCGYDDFMFNAWFEMAGFEGSEVEDQMRCFAEEVLPVLRRECGGSPEREALGLDLVPAGGAGRALVGSEAT
jgi:alkanesulfonate monooxygenase SsuD/methylene tetrahydromethanopterin reductase-like flavin-dependent oxidoreductase (luciferase family)